MVSHGHFLSSLLKLDHSHSEFSNAELRVYEMTERGFRPTLSTLWFKPLSAYHIHA